MKKYLTVLTEPSASKSAESLLQPSAIESFQDSQAPTRASDCRCLPGYIPAKPDINSHNGTVYSSFFTGEKVYLFNPTGTKSIYYISPTNSCNLLNSSNSGSKTFEFIGSGDIFGNKSKYSYNGQLDCSIVKSSEPSASEETYFCKNLSDSQITKACY
jgi:hypothetical protein